MVNSQEDGEIPISLEKRDGNLSIQWLSLLEFPQSPSSISWLEIEEIDFPGLEIEEIQIYNHFHIFYMNHCDYEHCTFVQFFSLQLVIF